jgi:hypothetical protein
VVLEQEGALHGFGQDRICSDGTLVATPSGEAQPSARRPTGGVGVPYTAPMAPPLSQAELERLADFVLSSQRLVVLTGAGVSTESNIPDYRGPQGAYSTGFKPMTHQQVPVLRPGIPRTPSSEQRCRVPCQRAAAPRLSSKS